MSRQSPRGNEPPPSRSEQYLQSALPSNVDAERTVLGAILIDNRLAQEVFTFLEPEDFYSQAHQRVAKAMRDLMRRAASIDPVLIIEEMKKDGSVADQLGGVAGLNGLTHGLIRFRSVKDYCEVIIQKSLARKTVRHLNAFASDVLNEENDLEEILARIATTFAAMRERKGADCFSDAKSVAAEVLGVFEQWSAGNFAMSSVSSGIPELDARLRLRGLAYGESTMIAARPSMGKTALLLQLSKHAAMLGVPSLIVTLEMTMQRLVMRMLPAITGIPNKAINPFTLKNDERERNKLMDALKIMDLPLFFDRSASLDKLLANAEHLVQTKGVKLIAIDFFTLINRENLAKDSYGRVTGLGDVAIAIADFAKRNNVAALTALQLNRESEKEYRRPRMTDIRDSGEIEQAADTIIFPYDKEAKFHAQSPELVRDKIWLDMYCDKQREGERNWSVPVEYDKDSQTFTSPEMSGRAAPKMSQPVPENFSTPAPAYVPSADDEPDFG